jgi:membrane protease YdiL (CAAX protease family)
MTLLALFVGFGVSVGLRVLVGGDDVARSIPAGLLFAGCLLALAFAARTRVTSSWQAVGLGVAGTVILCLPVGLAQLVALKPLHSSEGFVPWALAVVVVAGAEEVFLRGTLFDLIAQPWVAVGVSAVLFALLHVPMYGWEAVPLDLAVGIVLGGLRLEARSVVAPGIAHIGADLVGWFLR